MRKILTIAVVFGLLLAVVSVSGCEEGKRTVPGETAPQAGTAPSEERPTGETGPSEQEAGTIPPPEEKPAGKTGPSGQEAAGEIPPPDEQEAAEQTGTTEPSPEQEAEEETVTPSHGVDVTLEVDSTNPEGVKFVASERGQYELTIVGGASIHLPETDPNWPVYGGWRTRVIVYVNKAVEWGNPTEWGPQPINYDYELGSDETYPTPADAEEANRGASITVHLDKDDYLIVLEHDEQDYYYDNSGVISIRVTGY